MSRATPPPRWQVEAEKAGLATQPPLPAVQFAAALARACAGDPDGTAILIMARALHQLAFDPPTRLPETVELLVFEVLAEVGRHLERIERKRKERLHERR